MPTITRIQHCGLFDFIQFRYSAWMDCFWGPSGCILQVEIQLRKIYCVNRATPTLPINLEDAARSEAEFEKAEQVCSMHIMCFLSPLYSENTQHCAQDFLPIILESYCSSMDWLLLWLQVGEKLVRVGQDTRLNYRAIDLRTPSNQAVFRIQCQVENVSSWYCFY